MKYKEINTMYCIKATIYGTVQGVFYRQSTQKKAKELAITGWVKNTPHHTVELHACGIKENIDLLIAWLHEGPPASTVEKVEWGEIPTEDHVDFYIAR